MAKNKVQKNKPMVTRGEKEKPSCGLKSHEQPVTKSKNRSNDKIKLPPKSIDIIIYCILAAIFIALFIGLLFPK